MRRRFSRPIQSVAASLLAAGALATLATLGCGDGATHPAAPNVSGLYRVTTHATPVCDPASAVDVIGLAVGGGVPYTLNLLVRVEQRGGQVTLKALEVNGQNVEDRSNLLVTALGADGSFRVEAGGPPAASCSRSGRSSTRGR